MSTTIIEQSPPARPAVDAPQPANDADVLGNFHFWGEYAWPRGGEEWSEPWGGTENLWWCTLFPRLRTHLPPADSAGRPGGHILEIGCGFGRITEFLRRHASKVTAIDLTPRCVEACRARFADDPRVSAVLNDGMSLEAVADGSVDFAFSWDSLVNTSQAAVDSYLRGLARTLKPGAAAVLHCANLGAYADRLGGETPPSMIAGRRMSQSAERFRNTCREVGLRCISQELMPWGSTAMMTDHLSLVVRDEANAHKPPLVIDRPDWRQEVVNAGRIAALYGAESGGK